jgi:hypothetical protein
MMHFVSALMGQAAAGLVPCGWGSLPPCQLCDLLVLLQNVLNFVMFTLAPAIGVLMFIYAGIKVLFAAQNPSKISEGFNLMKTTAIGLLLIFGAYMFTNFIIRLLGDAGGVSFENWNTIQCTNPTATSIPIGGGGGPLPTFTGGGGRGGGGGGSGTFEDCTDPAGVAKYNNEPYPPKNDPGLNTLISCITDNMSKLDPGTGLGEQSSFDKKYEVCNYTRGATTCSSSCSHSVKSCHYGGQNGSTGAMAVDFGHNGWSSQSVGQEIVNAANQCPGTQDARCEDNLGQRLNCTDPGVTHVHVTEKGCNSSD